MRIGYFLAALAFCGLHGCTNSSVTLDYLPSDAGVCTGNVPACYTFRRNQGPCPSGCTDPIDGCEPRGCLGRTLSNCVAPHCQWNAGVCFSRTTSPCFDRSYSACAADPQCTWPLDECRGTPIACSELGWSACNTHAACTWSTP